MGQEIIDKYPSYKYVFNEFDIEKEYIYESDFNDFFHKNEKGLRLFYKRSLKRGRDILPTMKDLLVTEGVSDLFIYLSMVESGLSSSAISPKKAAGLWQFMPKTAQAYNLTVDDFYDERYDTVSATSAAISYLNKLYIQFGKWYLAVMAYNCGEGCMTRAIDKAGTDELSILLDKERRYLPLETREYIQKILIVSMIGENMTLDFTNNVNSLENGSIEVEISSKTTLKEIAKLIKIKQKVLKKLNISMLKKKNDHQKTYKIMIPISKVFAFYLRYTVKKEKKTRKLQTHYLSHVVVLGDTLKSISKKYNSNSKEIKKINRLLDIYLTVDKLLMIPVNMDTFEKYIQ
jgi:membrane-bound lytic murein transglycosylase D